LHDFDADGASIEHSGKERLNEGANYISYSTFKNWIATSIQGRNPYFEPNPVTFVFL
jgi:hypothetical protein